MCESMYRLTAPFIFKLLTNRLIIEMQINIDNEILKTQLYENLNECKKTKTC